MTESPEPHHPSWAWRAELWTSALLTGCGALAGAARHLPAAVTVLGTAFVVQAALLLLTYWHEGTRLQRIHDEERRRADRDVF